MLELLDRDAAGRICKWSIGRHTVMTPNICIVVNPNKMPVPVADLKKEFKADILITNSYIIRRSEALNRQAIEQGLHGMLGWNGPLYTDSGTYQMFSQGKVGVKPEEIIEYQKRIGSDIITPLDVFTLPTDNLKAAKSKLMETIARIKSAKTSNPGIDLVGPIQGGRFLPLRRAACKQVDRLDPAVFAIGGIVPLMMRYRFRDLSDVVLTCKANLPAHVPIHAFGAGHPMVFALLTAFGCDLFDSAMYSLAAERGAYLTVSGTHQLADLKEFPCSCPLCSHSEPKDVLGLGGKERLVWLARHNLYATFEELRTIRTAIRENSLWELVQERARAHPAVLAALNHGLKTYPKLFLELDPVSKKSALMWGGPETAVRPEVARAKEWLKRVPMKKPFRKEPFGKVPSALKSVYPFGQSVVERSEKPKKVKSVEIVNMSLDYQFGRGASKPFKKVVVEISRKTGRLRRLWSKDKVLLGTFRPSDGFFLPSVEGAKLLKSYIKKVAVKDSDVAGFVREGRAVFAKFATPQKGIWPGEEVAVVHNGKMIAVGKALLNTTEMEQMKRGVAVEIRAASRLGGSAGEAR
ncbi:MAG: tRNA guanosine(15) transglycosylase TgtA [Candidatus Aenigmatarchaeota archaeon]